MDTCVDVYHGKYAEAVQNRGKLIERLVSLHLRDPNDFGHDAVLLYNCSIGMSHGIHDWRIKIPKPNNGKIHYYHRRDAHGFAAINIGLCGKENIGGECWNDSSMEGLSCKLFFHQYYI